MRLVEHAKREHAEAAHVLARRLVGALEGAFELLAQRR